MSNIVGVGVYHTCSSEEVEWVVGNSDSKIIFVGNNPNDNDENDRIIAIISSVDEMSS